MKLQNDYVREISTLHDNVEILKLLPGMKQGRRILLEAFQQRKNTEKGVAIKPKLSGSFKSKAKKVRAVELKDEVKVAILVPGIFI